LTTGLTTRPVVIIGTGDFAQIARFYLEHDSDRRVIAHAVSETMLDRRELSGLPVVPLEELPSLYPPDQVDVQIAIAYSRVNRNRGEMFAHAKRLGYGVVTYVCSKAITWPGLDVGEGTFVFEGNILQPFVRIGEDTVLWSGSNVAHHSVIGSHVFIASQVAISGHCRVGDHTFIGANATLRDGVTIGSDCVIGAGALVLEDVPDGTVLKGATPATLSIQSRNLPAI
jgi:sugar O-acyltransferase (sialic acid O-acetyltransferase NeuD family)